MSGKSSAAQRPKAKRGLSKSVPLVAAPAKEKRRGDAPKRAGAPKVEKVFAETRQRILAVATKEFAARGFDGARIDEIMRQSKVSKNLIYHYFQSKERLFIAVLESAYQSMHQRQTDWPSEFTSPTEGIRALVRMIFDYWKQAPEFIGLLNSENFHKGRHLKKTKMIKAGYAGLLAKLDQILKEGEATGAFRPNVDAVELYISISSLAYHFFSNRYTLSFLLDREFSLEKHMQARLQHIEEFTLAYLQRPD